MKKYYLLVFAGSIAIAVISLFWIKAIDVNNEVKNETKSFFKNENIAIEYGRLVLKEYFPESYSENDIYIAIEKEDRWIIKKQKEEVPSAIISVGGEFGIEFKKNGRIIKIWIDD